LLRADKAPDFVNLEPLAWEALKDAILIPSRRHPGIDD
jgi:hypothetical protein